MKNTNTDYTALQQELESILDELQRDDIDVDRAMIAYKRGLEIVAELEVYLKKAENTVEVLQAKFSKDG